jgi:hypothetical protein
MQCAYLLVICIRVAGPTAACYRNVLIMEFLLSDFLSRPLSTEHALLETVVP